MKRYRARRLGWRKIIYSLAARGTNTGSTMSGRFRPNQVSNAIQGMTRFTFGFGARR